MAFLYRRPKPQPRLLARRRMVGLESLESRSLLAAGVIAFDLTFPIEDIDNNGISTVGSASIASKVVILDPGDLSQLSVTDIVATAAGTFDGELFGVIVTGRFTVDDPMPELTLTFNSGSSGQPDLIDVEAHFEGQLDLCLGDDIENGCLAGELLSAAFDADVIGRFDVNARSYEGNTTITVPDLDLTRVVSTQVPNAIPASFEFPDPSLASIADQVFGDANDNGIFDDNEVGVSGVEVVLLGVSGGVDSVLDTVETDEAGFYSFYNLPAGQYAVKVDSLPAGLEVGKQDVGPDDSVDSDADSQTGRTGTLTLTGSDHLRNVDIGLRPIAEALEVLDVNGDGTSNPFQDGILIVRFMLGQPAANLEDPALIPAGSTRTTGRKFKLSWQPRAMPWMPMAMGTSIRSKTGS